MPQGRRKTPFSGKAKKQQLQNKRNNRQDQSYGEAASAGPMLEEKLEDSVVVANPSGTQSKSDKSSLHMDITFSSGDVGRRKYDLVFQKESNVEIAQRREEARKVFQMVDIEETGQDLDHYYPSSVDFPQRPRWKNTMSKAQLEANEAKYFRDYVSKIMEKHENSLSYFELNLETWRQLWRVTEMSDVLLLIVDVRYVATLAPPSLIRSVKPKPVIIVLNKVDLVPSEIAIAWKHYFVHTFPNVQVTFFTSCPAYNLRNPSAKDHEGMQFRKLRGKISMVKEGALQILDALEELGLTEKGSLMSWREKIVIANSIDDDNIAKDSVTNEASDIALDQVLTIGTIGYPNVGKSSLINSLMGKRVVSVSKTPGHTKHFQTIFINSKIRLCDCPGLVFPSLVPRPAQIVCGSYPISQTREPYSALLFLAQRVDLPKVLKLPRREKPWTVFDICEAWAEKRGYITARSNRLDVARAANHLLRMALEGRICLCLRPPKEFHPEKFVNDPDVSTIKNILAFDKVSEDTDENISNQQVSEEDQSSEEEEEEEDDTLTTDKNKFSALLQSTDE